MKLLQNKFVAYVSICLVVFLVYGNTIKHSFTLDDKRLITGNELVKSFSVKALVSHGTFYGFNKDNAGAYRPVSMLFYTLTYKISGGKSAGMHFGVIMFYAVFCCLIFNYLTELFKAVSNEILFLITCVFVTLTIHTEVVANIKSVDEILCGIGLVWALNLILKSEKQSSINYQITLFLALMMSVLSKETGLATLVIVAYTAFNKWKNDSFPTLISIASIIILYFIFRNTFLDKPLLVNNLQLEINNTLFTLSGLGLIWAKIQLWGVYFSKLIFPYPLQWDYSTGAFPGLGTINLYVIIGFIVLIISMLGLIFNYKNISRIISLWFLIPLLLVSNSFILIETTFAERFLLLPSLVLLFLFVFVYQLVKRKNVFVLILVLIGLVNASFTIKRNKIWKDDYSLATESKSPNPSARMLMASAGEWLNESNALINSPLRDTLLLKAEIDAAKACYLIPKDAEVNYLLGNIYLNEKKYELAEMQLQKAIAIDSKHVKALNDLAVVAGQNANQALALQFVLKVLQIEPNNEKALENAGLLYFVKGDYKNAKLMVDRCLIVNYQNVRSLQILAEINKMK